MRLLIVVSKIFDDELPTCYLLSEIVPPVLDMSCSPMVWDSLSAASLSLYKIGVSDASSSFSNCCTQAASFAPSHAAIYSALGD